MATRRTTLAGHDWREASPEASPDAVVRLAGTVAGAPARLEFSRDDLATHVLMLGPSGTGKTNVLREALRQVKGSLRPGDTMCVFDPKGDFLPLLDPTRDLAVPGGAEVGHLDDDLVLLFRLCNDHFLWIINQCLGDNFNQFFHLKHLALLGDAGNL